MTETALAVREQSGMSVAIEDYAMSISQLVNQVYLIQQVMKEVMKKDEHYGVIPGCKKPSLYKPGAEKLSTVFRFAPEYEIRRYDLPNAHREYEIICTLRHIPTGKILGQGVGSCSTMEAKYRFREAGRKCPSCGAEAIIKGKEEYGGGWICYKKKGGCGAKFSDKAAEIVGQEVGKIEYDNPADYYNTVLKIGKKRAHVDAILTATAASDIFTQDIEDMKDFIKKHPDNKSEDIEDAITVEAEITDEALNEDAGFMGPEGKYKGMTWLELPKNVLDYIAGERSAATETQRKIATHLLKIRDPGTPLPQSKPSEKADIDEPPPYGQPEPPKILTDDQRKTIFALGRELGWDKEQIKTNAEHEWGIVITSFSASADDPTTFDEAADLIEKMDERKKTAAMPATDHDHEQGADSLSSGEPPPPSEKRKVNKQAVASMEIFIEDAQRGKFADLDKAAVRRVVNDVLRHYEADDMTKLTKLILQNMVERIERECKIGQEELL